MMGPTPDRDLCQIELLGPLRITGPQGEDLTPSGAKTQGLVALLSMASSKGCSRAWLQDKLWSDRGQIQGRNSLKKALSELRAALGPYGISVLEAKSGHLAIRMDKVLIDVFSEPGREDDAPLIQPEFLEGIDIRDSEFNAWLQSVRSALSDGNEDAHTRRSEQRLAQPKPSGDQVNDPTVTTSSILVGLLPVTASGNDGTSQLLGEMVMDRLAFSLTNHGIFSVFDYRKDHLTLDAADQPIDLILEVRAFANAGALSLHILLQRYGDRALIWGGSKILDLADFGEKSISALVSQLSDLLANAVLRRCSELDDDRHKAAGHALRGVDHMFRISATNLDFAEQSFRQAIELDPKAQYYAWYAYLSAFRTEEFKGVHRPEFIEHTEHLMRRSLETDSNNGLSLALLTHVCGFVFRDYERAFSLINRSLSIQRDLAMLHDSHAMLHFYTGDLESASQAAEYAMRCGLHSPYCYSFATSLCMINAVKGDFDAAVLFGERALALHPPGTKLFFEPALRFLCASYGHLSAERQAATVLDQLRLQDPEISSKRFAEPGYPVPSLKALSMLKSGFENIEKYYKGSHQQ